MRTELVFFVFAHLFVKSTCTVVSELTFLVFESSCRWLLSVKHSKLDAFR